MNEELNNYYKWIESSKLVDLEIGGMKSIMRHGICGEEYWIVIIMDTPEGKYQAKMIEPRPHPKDRRLPLDKLLEHSVKTALWMYNSDKHEYKGENSQV